MHPHVIEITEAARAQGIEIEIREFRETTRTAEDAARVIGCEVGRIVKSLVFIADERPLLALVSGGNRASLSKLAALAGAERVAKADARRTQQVTGFSIGGVPPFAPGLSLPVFVDKDLAIYDRVWAAAGTPRSVFSIRLPDLLRATSGKLVDLKEVDSKERV